MAGLNPGIGGMVAGAALGGGIVSRALGLGSKKKKTAAAGGTDPSGLLEGGLASIPGFFGNPKREAAKPEVVGTGGGADAVAAPPKKKKKTGLETAAAAGTILGKSGLTGGVKLPPGVQSLGGTKTVLGA